MKRLLAALSLALIAGASQADVGVSVSIGEPGFYGQIDIGDAPQPEVIRTQPVIVQKTTVVQQPIYVRVPPEHMQHWSRYCGQYHGCDRKVYFVKDNWYRDVYVPHYQDRHHHDHDENHDRHDEHHDQGHHDHDQDRHDHHDHNQDDYRHYDDHRDN